MMTRSKLVAPAVHVGRANVAELEDLRAMLSQYFRFRWGFRFKEDGGGKREKKQVLFAGKPNASDFKLNSERKHTCGLALACWKISNCSLYFLSFTF